MMKIYVAVFCVVTPCSNVVGFPPSSVCEFVGNRSGSLGAAASG
jgi:hypothetical protein